MALTKAPAKAPKKSAKTFRLAASYLPEVDAYIAKREPFAQPLLEHLRGVIHKAVPDVEEQIKWSMPFFVYKGIILANIAGFKQHISLGIWKENVLPLMKPGVERRGTGMGSFGKITSKVDMPSDKELLALLKEATRKIDVGERTSSFQRPKTSPRPPADVPAPLAAALKKNKLAQTNFAAMSVSCQREYIEWINEARREETRAARIATTVEWSAEGKRRNWKYEKS